MRPSTKLLPLLLVTALLPGCEDGPPWDTDEPSTVESRPDFGRTAAYDRRLLFVGPGEPLPTAAIFDFTSLSDSLGVRRGVRARVLLEDEWVPLMDEGWVLEPMREPWRIVPGGALDITVDDAGDMAAVIYSGDPGVRLQPGALLAERSPDGGTQFLLRQATLAADGETLRGILLDAQLGRTVNPATVPRPRPDATTAADPASEGTGQPTPVARPGAEAFLVNNSGYYAVFAAASDGDIAWISHADNTDDIIRNVVLEPTAWSEAEGGATAAPTQWRVAGMGTLTGELSAAVTDTASLPGLGSATQLGYTLVSGWIGEAGVRRDVFGIVRQVR